MTDYTNYWPPAVADSECGFPIDQTFGRYSRTIAGDRLWAITVENGRLYLLGKGNVLLNMSKEEAEEHYKEHYSEEMKNTRHISFSEPFDIVAWRDITEIAGSIRFQSKDRAQLSSDPGEWPYSLQTPRTLTPETVSLLTTTLLNFPKRPTEMNKNVWLDILRNDVGERGEGDEVTWLNILEEIFHAPGHQSSVLFLSNTLDLRETDVVRLVDSLGRSVATKYGIKRRIPEGDNYFANWEVLFDGIQDESETSWKLKPALTEAIDDFYSKPVSDREVVEDLVGVSNDEPLTDVHNQGSLTIATGAGFGDFKKNKEVEEASVLFVRNDYEKRGWRVTSKESEKCGYDLLCEKASDIEHIEVKGASGALESILLTRNEFNYLESSHSFVCIVTSSLSNPKLTKYSGLEFKQKFELAPYSYRATKKQLEVAELNELNT